MKLSDQDFEGPIRGEIYSVERLEEYAAYLAAQLKVSDDPSVSQPLLPRMRENGRELLASYRVLTAAIHKKETISPAAEWLADNFHIIEDQLREIQEDLPPVFYKELPKIALGDLSGYPRIYAVALALIAHTDSQLEPETIRRFVQAYQKVSPLSIGELWALAITLRLVLVENLRRIALRIVWDLERRKRADEVADQLFETVGSPAKFNVLVSELPTHCGGVLHNDCAFMAQLAKRMRDQEPELWPALESLEKHLAHENFSTEQVVNYEHQLQASNQVTVANIITSMRLLSSLNWQDFFESLSLVDRVLENDGSYEHMDFATRDRYRHVIERLAKRTGVSEIIISEAAIQLARDSQTAAPNDKKQSHVGYYLIDRGFEKLEKQFDQKIRINFLKAVRSHPNLVYFGLLGLLLAAACVLPVRYALFSGASFKLLILVVCFILIPCSEMAVNAVNFILTHTIKPLRLPKLDLSSGIPQEARTMVVIPCMLSGERIIHELLEKLEIYYLGNKDEQLFFGLLTDFCDASEKSMATDEDDLKIALEGIAKLNRQYANAGATTAENKDRFFLFHRQRQWNNSEKTWMGWERKRGKIHEFNRVLRGAENTSFYVITAPQEFLPTIRFVITLDADTQLPRDTAHKLVGTILHPLNQPHFDKTLGRVTEGYGVLQPRIGISLESSSRSHFSKIFSGHSGIDPYTTAVSDVYQDLLGEGSYTGKGLYDVDAFEAALENRIPENTVLSHDLFEGIYSRTALLTDVELIDDYPQSYDTFFKRQHRWTRGDWQIAAWILPLVRSAQGQWVKNQMLPISRWKLFDNLRRSLVAPSTFLWFFLAWTFFPGSPNFWVEYGFFIIFFPCILQVCLNAGITFSGIYNTRVSTKKVRTKINFTQILLYFVFLAHQTYFQLDAIVRVIYRSLISKTKLLEWVTAADGEINTYHGKQPLWQTCVPTEILLVGTALLISEIRPGALVVAAPILLIWTCYPVVSGLISRRLLRKKKNLDANGKLVMREIARRTWHYFETFVGPEDNWLPPDNYQESPQPVVAHRTSPTNMGLYILSLLSAKDLGYVSLPQFRTLLLATLGTMQKMEQFEGHYFNWYDTRTLQPLNPKYVSTVDSGNLAGYLLAAKQGCLEAQNDFFIDGKILNGLKDTLTIIKKEIDQLIGVSGNVDVTGLDDLRAEFLECEKLLLPPVFNSFFGWSGLLRVLLTFHESVKNRILTLKVQQPKKDFEKILQWTDFNMLQIRDAQEGISIVAPWTTDRFFRFFNDKFSEKMLKKWNALIEGLDRNMAVTGLPGSFHRAIEGVQEMIEGGGEANTLFQDLSQFLESLRNANETIALLLSDFKKATEITGQIFEKMNFKFLLEKDRGVFSIGYNVTDGKLDSGLYDLLASESRLASFIAIAKGDVPQEHWFKLGRQLVPMTGGAALISWTASMFEYLMPLLVMQDYENTLLNETFHSVVLRQIKYGKEYDVPWGVSEAGYHARDLQLNYQYGPFGIPGLGLKRGLSHDLVISPYSTLLAAMIDGPAALENLRHLIDNQLLTAFGFYESIDYTSERLPENQKFAVIKSFMAHHQGMSLTSVNNVINNNRMQKRFHSEPRVRATRLLLQERIPRGVVPILPKAAEVELESEQRATINPYIRHYTDPNTSTPRVQLLSNRNYSVMISTAGSGYSKCGDLAVTRWREDATRDNTGSFIFIKDLSQSMLWSTTYQPLAKIPESYKVTFGEDKVEFRRRDGDISTYTQIIVAPEDNVEIRHLTLTNHGTEPRILEITSYLEPVLATLSSDLSHPAFSKLFIQTEFLSSKNALLAKRRKRSHHDRESWGLHVVVTDGEILGDLQHETDRARFIGRGRSVNNPLALSGRENLSNTTGATLDPIMSLRVRVRVPAGEKIHVAFTTGLASSREDALVLADRYHDIHSFDRESKLSWTKSQVDLRHLNIDSETAYLFQRLAERILYSEPSLRPPSNQLALNTNVQSCLWPHGISGDLPIVVLRVSDREDLSVVRKLLRCHEYLRLKGLVYDFVILNDHETTYAQGLQDELQVQIRATGSFGWLNKPGGLFILRSDITPERDRGHIQSVARVSISADLPLKDQIDRKTVEEKYPPTLLFTAKKETASVFQKMPLLDLNFFNGFGGFSQNGKEYVIILKAGQWTPAPWINVIGNRRDFGFQISESGSGFTWSINSQTNRLTPWSNDPISDPPGEIIYLRDDDTGEVWTATPLPIRGESPYTIKHGRGYTTFEHCSHGLLHTLNVFVPKDDTIKISRLTLKNLSQKKRRISITSYTEWVLGSQREKTSPHLICDVDQKSGAIFARNPHDNDFANRVAFADISEENRTFTCSRKEFLGRNGSYADPAALKRDGLSRKRGTGQDPCAVIQSSFELGVGAQREVTVLLGQCENVDAARVLTLRYRNHNTVKSALEEVMAYWDNLLNVIQVKTPEPAMDTLMNSWLLYQTLSCRYWSRTALYQSGGAYGFRDQLQDCMALVYAAPEIAKEHILRTAQHQFKEGDVQHWWHPPTGRGIRTRMSDDLLWLPFVVSFYVNVTGDNTILTAQVPFLEAPLLKPEEEDSFTLPKISAETATLFEHCIRAINHSLTTGQHGLPLMGTGDWNDGMNRVGAQGIGESVWLGWFLYKVLADFSPFCDQPEQDANREKYVIHMNNLKQAIEKNGWDGNWYRRAYFDDGSPLGSASSDECRIDSIAQSWSVLSQAGDPLRSVQAMEKLAEFLIQKKSQLILLLTPPFDQSPRDPGYIKGYVPGVRENGGQYTHAAIWALMAYAELGDGNRALELFNMLNPIYHSQNTLEANKYKIEPYVIAADVYAGDSHDGRGGWSWYTGSASWYYRAGLESLLGFHLRGDKLKIAPCIPSTWKGYEIFYTYGKTKYSIEVKNPKGLNRGNVSLEIDGILLSNSEIPLVDDGKDHRVIVHLEPIPTRVRPSAAETVQII